MTELADVAIVEFPAGQQNFNGEIAASHTSID